MKAAPLLVGCLWASIATPAPLNAYQGTQGVGTIMVAPGATVSTDGTIEPATAFAGALGRKGDINLGIGAAGSMEGGPWTAGLDLMPRFFPVESLGFGAHLAFDGSGVGLGPEVHHIFERNAFSLTTNLGWMTTVGQPADSGELFLFVSPEVAVNDRFGVFVEVNPVVPLGVPTESVVSFIPGVSANFGHDGSTSATLGVSVPAQKNPTVSVGATLTMNFGASARVATAETGGSPDTIGWTVGAK